MIVYKIIYKNSKSGKIIMDINNPKYGSANASIPRMQDVLERYSFNTANSSCLNEMYSIMRDYVKTKDTIKFNLVDGKYRSTDKVSELS